MVGATLLTVRRTRAGAWVGSSSAIGFLLARSSIQSKHFSSPGIPPSPP